MFFKSLVTMLIMTTPVAAQTSSEKRALSNLHHEMITCIAYYTIMRQCLENTPNSTEAVARTGKVIDNLMEFSFKVGSGINMTPDAMSARLKIAIEEQMTLIRKDCVNGSSLMARHAGRCKAVTENPDSVYSEYLKK
jgi:hypothetical protein